MKVMDELRLAKGVVSPSFVDIATGKRVSFAKRHNTLSYMAAEAVAAAFGGDPSFIPARIGFIYGDQAVMPSESETGDSSSASSSSDSSSPSADKTSSISRVQSWSALAEELQAASGSVVDVQVVNFSYAPSLGGEKDAGSSSSGSADENDYNHILSTGSNAITFHAVSNSSDRGVLHGSDAFSASKNNYIYQCLLLGYYQGDYYIIARASLKDGDKYLKKPEGFEVALDWTVVFH